jgi:hypothetical protein
MKRYCGIVKVEMILMEYLEEGGRGVLLCGLRVYGLPSLKIGQFT